MIRPGFLSPSERHELEAYVLSQREDHGVARRGNAISLLDEGKSCQAIAEFLYLDDETIRGWHKTYREAGWDALSVDGRKGGQARMTSAQETELSAWLDGRFCHSAAPIMAHIAAQYGLEYSHSGCLKLLARLGFEYRKPKGLPSVASAEKQAKLIALYELLLKGLGEDEAVYFAFSKVLFLQCQILVSELLRVSVVTRLCNILCNCMKKNEGNQRLISECESNV